MPEGSAYPRWWNWDAQGDAGEVTIATGEGAAGGGKTLALLELEDEEAGVGSRGAIEREGNTLAFLPSMSGSPSTDIILAVAFRPRGESALTKTQRI